MKLLAVKASSSPSRARVCVFFDQVSQHRISKYLTGKFCEHLGSNVLNGMCAQILRNPTFADFPFHAGGETPDGRARFQCDEAKIAEELRRSGQALGWPAEGLERLVPDRVDGLATWWIREGPREDVRPSPDTSQSGGRAQRIEVKKAACGLAQWIHLPLHRTKTFEVELTVRSPNISAIDIYLYCRGGETPVARVRLTDLSDAWATFRMPLVLPASCPADVPYRLAIIAQVPGQFVVSRALLWPSDHINGADPDVVRLLKESRLPVLRWPGGNFVSGYRWEDGIGPLEKRPTRPNWAWAGVEPNIFGTDEFIAFCRAVGCEPMICINAGDGTPEEAARWVEYCNGPPDSPMGALRAAHGHPEPYNVMRWEVGNELWGRWQVHWTTPAGYVDRWRRFSKAMLAADPRIRLYACAAPMLWDEEWNRTLLTEAGPTIPCLADHVLVGGPVDDSTDPLDVYRDFMAFPSFYEHRYAKLALEMAASGVERPALAITELQLFAHIVRSGGSPRLSHEKLAHPGTLAEALYDLLIYHMAVRLGPFIELITHSATVNHGGGLRKERERVYANPCHYAQSAFVAFAGAKPVPIELESPLEHAPGVLPDFKKARCPHEFAALDALAAFAEDGALLLSLVHRGTQGPVDTEIVLEGVGVSGDAKLWLLSAEHPWAANTLERPDAVRPSISNLHADGNRLRLELRPFSAAQIAISTR